MLPDLATTPIFAEQPIVADRCCKAIMSESPEPSGSLGELLI